MTHVQWSTVLTVLFPLQVAQHLPIFTDLVQQAQGGDVSQQPTAAAYAMIFAEWANGCVAAITMGMLRQPKACHASSLLQGAKDLPASQDQVAAMDAHNACGLKPPDAE